MVVTAVAQEELESFNSKGMGSGDDFGFPGEGQIAIAAEVLATLRAEGG
jgi:hypothetical protein